MKAVLVIDIPEDYTGSVISANIYSGNNKLIHEIYVNKLRPMPEKKDADILAEFTVSRIFNTGWNACLKEIEK